MDCRTVIVLLIVGAAAPVLVTFSRHLPPPRLRRVLEGCDCEPLQLHRTVGEMQLAVGGDARRPRR